MKKNLLMVLPLSFFIINCGVSVFSPGNSNRLIPILKEKDIVTNSNIENVLNIAEFYYIKDGITNLSMANILVNSLVSKKWELMSVNQKNRATFLLSNILFSELSKEKGENFLTIFADILKNYNFKDYKFKSLNNIDEKTKLNIQYFVENVQLYEKILYHINSNYYKTVINLKHKISNDQKNYYYTLINSLIISYYVGFLLFFKNKYQKYYIKSIPEILKTIEVKAVSANKNKSIYLNKPTNEIYLNNFKESLNEFNKSFQKINIIAKPLNYFISKINTLKDISKKIGKPEQSTYINKEISKKIDIIFYNITNIYSSVQDLTIYKKLLVQ